MKFILVLKKPIDCKPRKTWFCVNQRILTVRDLIDDIKSTLGIKSHLVLKKDEISMHPSLYVREVLSENDRVEAGTKEKKNEFVPKKKLKREPELRAFQGKHIKFDEPTERNLADEGPGKQRVKRFGEFHKTKGITENYSFDISHFTKANTNSLQTGDVILFKTLELNEEKLVPAMSDYKKGLVQAIQGESVDIALLRDVQENEEKILEELEVIDDLTLMKFQITVDKKWIIDLHILNK